MLKQNDIDWSSFDYKSFQKLEILLEGNKYQYLPSWREITPIKWNASYIKAVSTKQSFDVITYVQNPNNESASTFIDLGDPTAKSPASSTSIIFPELENLPKKVCDLSDNDIQLIAKYTNIPAEELKEVRSLEQFLEKSYPDYRGPSKVGEYEEYQWCRSWLEPKDKI